VPNGWLGDGPCRRPATSTAFVPYGATARPSTARIIVMGVI
jgi:hypothetical protein